LDVNKSLTAHNTSQAAPRSKRGALALSAVTFLIASMNLLAAFNIPDHLYVAEVVVDRDPRLPSPPLVTPSGVLRAVCRSRQASGLSDSEETFHFWRRQPSIEVDETKMDGEGIRIRVRVAASGPRLAEELALACANSLRERERVSPCFYAMDRDRARKETWLSSKRCIMLADEAALRSLERQWQGPNEPGASAALARAPAPKERNKRLIYQAICQSGRQLHADSRSVTLAQYLVSHARGVESTAEIAEPLLHSTWQAPNLNGQGQRKRAILIAIVAPFCGIVSLSRRNTIRSSRNTLRFTSAAHPANDRIGRMGNIALRRFNRPTLT
jgi:hypothetical protein